MDGLEEKVGLGLALYECVFGVGYVGLILGLVVSVQCESIGDFCQLLLKTGFLFCGFLSILITVHFGLCIVCGVGDCE